MITRMTEDYSRPDDRQSNTETHFPAPASGVSSCARSRDLSPHCRAVSGAEACLHCAIKRIGIAYRNAQSGHSIVHVIKSSLRARYDYSATERKNLFYGFNGDSVYET